jgi:hypothetical protein
MVRSFFVRLVPVVCIGAASVGTACGGATFTAAAGDDGGTADASGDDAGDAAADAPLSWCETQPHHYLCDDFDKRSNDLKGTVWSSLIITPQANLEIDAQDFTSSPRSLVALTTQGHIQNTDADALLIKQGVLAKTLDVAFDVKVDAYGGDGTVTTGVVFADVTYGSVSYQLGIVSNTQLVFNEEQTTDGGTGMMAPQTISMGLGSGWTHVEMRLTLPLAVQAGNVAVSVGGATVLTRPLTFPAMAALSDIAIGLALRNAPNQWKVRFDNVTIDRT